MPSPLYGVRHEMTLPGPHFLFSVFTCAVSSGVCWNCLCEQHAYCHWNPLTGKPAKICCRLESFTCTLCQSKPFLALVKKKQFQCTCCATRVLQKKKPGAKLKLTLWECCGCLVHDHSVRIDHKGAVAAPKRQFLCLTWS